MSRETLLAVVGDTLSAIKAFESALPSHARVEAALRDGPPLQTMLYRTSMSQLVALVNVGKEQLEKLQKELAP